MATKLSPASAKTGGRVAPAGKRVRFDHGRAKADGAGRPLKTAAEVKE